MPDSSAVRGSPPGAVQAGNAAATRPVGLAWPGDDDDWAGESLTALEIAELAAGDAAGRQPTDAAGWDQDLGWDPGDGLAPGQPADVDAWLPVDVDAWSAALPPDLRDPYLDGPPAQAAREALPGLMPRRMGTGGGFDAGGVADRVPPGPVLAGLAADKWAAGLAKATDDELAGLMIAWRRLASWAAAGELAAVAELSRRRDAEVAAGADSHLAEHVADEVAMVLTLTSWSAGTLVDRAVGLAALPTTRQALAAGLIDVPKALVILGEVTGLSAPHAARVEAAVVGRAPDQTTGELRRAVRRAVIAVDPDAAQKRKEKALKDARVERWEESNGTAALAGRDLPPAGVLAADAYLTAWAHRLKAAGLDGTMDQLRSRVYLALLGGQPPQSLLPAAAGTASEPGPDAGSATGMSSGSGSPPATLANSGPLPGIDGAASPGGSTGTINPGPICGSVNLTLPLATWLGWSSAPGEVAGFGPVDAQESRALATALARTPATKWCLTITDAAGQPVAHGCAKPGADRPLLRQGAGTPGEGAYPPSPQGPGPPREVRSSPQETPGSPQEAPGPAPAALSSPVVLGAWLTKFKLAWLEPGECSHQHESPGYRPSASLAHLVQIRQQACTAPGCRRPATQCDAEHTVPFGKGGRTCLCNLGPCCRRHHRAKQTAGWRLEQPRPGVFRWTTPLGRAYTTGPAEYAVG